ncbi:hypothetical protein [Nocardia abscessus]|uniref:hypothetical protein n=1 Tax=Nocardia abscessus TaxID=120957 RepID=UPI002458CDEE|nr:hypothetical protein [Nocardia abscessus]
MPDKAVTVIGLVVEQLRVFFAPDSARPPLGGGTETVHVLAGDTVVPPPWLAGDDQDSCADCGPYLWVRLARRWRTKNFPEESAAAGCDIGRAITVEVGIARCHPLEGTPLELEEHAACQWDDSWRIENALCRAMRAAEEAQAATDTVVGAGEPFGPDGLVLVWTQIAHARL